MPSYYDLDPSAAQSRGELEEKPPIRRHDFLYAPVKPHQSIASRWFAFLVLAFSIVLIAFCLSMTGCAGTPAMKAYKVVNTSNKSIKVAITGYEDAVKAGYVSSNTIVLAKQALEQYKAAAHLVAHAAEAVSTSTNDAPLTIAIETLNATKIDLLNIITQYTITKP